MSQRSFRLVNGLSFPIAVMADVDSEKFSIVVAPKSAMEDDDSPTRKAAARVNEDNGEIFLIIAPNKWRELGINDGYLTEWDGGNELAKHFNMVTLELDFDAAVGDYIVPDDEIPYVIITEFFPEQRLCNTQQRFDS